MVLVVVFGLSPPACTHSNGPASPDGPNDLSVEDYFAKLADATCTSDVTCGSFPDQATCLGASLDDGTIASTIARVKDGTVVYDASAASACLDSIVSSACTFMGFKGNADGPCANVFTGTITGAGACFASMECASAGECTPTDPNCDTSTTCCSGTCVAPMLSSANGPCDGSVQLCEPGLYCTGTQDGTVTGTCVPCITVPGAACDDFFACANPFYCNIDDTGMGTCVTPAASQAACNVNDSIPCSDQTEYCDSTTNKCTAKVAVGGSCDVDDSQCVGYANCVNGTCVAYPGLGGTCSEADGVGCLGTLTCTAGTCQAPPAVTDCGPGSARSSGDGRPHLLPSSQSQHTNSATRSRR